MEREENKKLKKRPKEMEDEESTKHARRILQRSSECLDEQFNSYIYTHIYIYIPLLEHLVDGMAGNLTCMMEYLYIFCCLNAWWLECLQMFY
jgi:hypothetical protein